MNVAVAKNAALRKAKRRSRPPRRRSDISSEEGSDILAQPLLTGKGEDITGVHRKILWA